MPLQHFVNAGKDVVVDQLEVGRKARIVGVAQKQLDHEGIVEARVHGQFFAGDAIKQKVDVAAAGKEGVLFFPRGFGVRGEPLLHIVPAGLRPFPQIH